ncbi:MAG: HAD family phosphatase [Gemmatimonadaceae bacterium]
MVDALFIELEGVLAETLSLRRRALQSTLAADGLPFSDDLFAEQCWGLATREAVRAALGAAGAERDDVVIDLMTARADRAFTAGLALGFALAPGARELLVAAHGLTRLALVTRASRHSAEPMLALASLEDAFECIVTADDTLDGKPAAAPYRRAIERLARRRAVDPSRVIALEDALPGIRGARAGGVRPVAVGAAPHVAVEADACVTSLVGQTPARLGELAAIDRGARAS